jgi:hypothetical protein
MSCTSELDVTETDWSTSHPVIVPVSTGKGRGGGNAGGAAGITGAGPPAAPGTAEAIMVSYRIDRSNLGNYDGWVAAVCRILSAVARALDSVSTDGGLPLGLF